jgi:hypothetical protein
MSVIGTAMGKGKKDNMCAPRNTGGSTRLSQPQTPNIDESGTVKSRILIALSIENGPMYSGHVKLFFGKLTSFPVMNT